MMNFGMLSIAILFLKVEPVDLVKTALGLAEDMAKKDKLWPAKNHTASATEPDRLPNRQIKCRAGARD